MDDMEKVIKALECCINAGDCQNQCDYWPDDRCEHLMVIDALELLKAQEPMKPIVTGNGHTFEEAETWWYECGNCNTQIDPSDKYCRKCGRAVEWDG